MVHDLVRQLAVELVVDLPRTEGFRHGLVDGAHAFVHRAEVQRGQGLDEALLIVRIHLDGHRPEVGALRQTDGGAVQDVHHEVADVVPVRLVVPLELLEPALVEQVRRGIGDGNRPVTDGDRRDPRAGISVILLGVSVGGHHVPEIRDPADPLLPAEEIAEGAQGAPQGVQDLVHRFDPVECVEVVHPFDRDIVDDGRHRLGVDGRKIDGYGPVVGCQQVGEVRTVLQIHGASTVAEAYLGDRIDAEPIRLLHVGFRQYPVGALVSVRVQPAVPVEHSVLGYGCELIGEHLRQRDAALPGHGFHQGRPIQCKREGVVAVRVDREIGLGRSGLGFDPGGDRAGAADVRGGVSEGAVGIGDAHRFGAELHVVGDVGDRRAAALHRELIVYPFDDPGLDGLRALRQTSGLGVGGHRTDDLAESPVDVRCHVGNGDVDGVDAVLDPVRGILAPTVVEGDGGREDGHEKYRHCSYSERHASAGVVLPHDGGFSA